MTLSDIRREYLGEPLDEKHSDPDPFRQFSLWFDQVRGLEQDPTAMALATATRDGRPSVRTVLLKGIDGRGFVFFTNYASRKAREIEQTGRASLLFLWRTVERQVRIDGTVEKTSDDESDLYFATRPLESRWSVYASRQSDPVESRRALDSVPEQSKDPHLRRFVVFLALVAFCPAAPALAQARVRDDSATAPATDSSHRR